MAIAVPDFRLPFHPQGVTSINRCQIVLLVGRGRKVWTTRCTTTPSSCTWVHASY